MNEPLTGEHFTVKLIEHTANTESKTVYEMDILCNETCRAEKRVFYKLTNFDANSIYIVEVTVISLYGESSKIDSFEAQENEENLNIDFLQQNSFFILLGMAGVILLFIIIAVIVISICIGCCCAKKWRGNTAPTIRSGELQMYASNRLSYDPYGSARLDRRDSHRYSETNMTLIRNTGDSVYSNINEFCFAQNRNSGEPDNTEIYELMTPIATKKEENTNVST